MANSKFTERAEKKLNSKFLGAPMTMFEQTKADIKKQIAAATAGLLEKFDKENLLLEKSKGNILKRMDAINTDIEQKSDDLKKLERDKTSLIETGKSTADISAKIRDIKISISDYIEELKPLNDRNTEITKQIELLKQQKNKDYSKIITGKLQEAGEKMLAELLHCCEISDAFDDAVKEFNIKNSVYPDFVNKLYDENGELYDIQRAFMLVDAAQLQRLNILAKSVIKQIDIAVRMKKDFSGYTIDRIKQLEANK